METPSKEQIKAGFAIVQSVAEAIRTAGQIPAGKLYAVMMGHVSLEQFEKVVALLQRSKLVERDDSHLLRWTGPTL